MTPDHAYPRTGNGHWTSNSRYAMVPAERSRKEVAIWIGVCRLTSKLPDRHTDSGVNIQIQIAVCMRKLCHRKKRRYFSRTILKLLEAKELGLKDNIDVTICGGTSCFEVL